MDLNWEHIKQILKRREPLTIVEDRVRMMLDRWKREFPEYRVEAIVVDVKLSGKLFSWKAGLLVTLKRKE